MTEQTEIKIRSANNSDCGRVQNLVFGVLREYELKPDPDGTDLDITDIEAYYLKRGGIFEVLEDERGNLLGTVGLYPVDAETIELRKMYFHKNLRGRGFGRATLTRMIELARSLGYKRIYLETANVLEAAVSLYEKFGFEKTDEKHTPRCDQAYFLNLDR